MRYPIAIVSALFCACALAQSRPPRLEPLPEALPPPRLSGADEPAVRIPAQSTDKVEEIRQQGRVVMLKVTQPGGRVYYLVDTTGSGNWMRKESLDDGVRVPLWPIYIFD